MKHSRSHLVKSGTSQVTRVHPIPSCSSLPFRSHSAPLWVFWFVSHSSSPFRVLLSRLFYFPVLHFQDLSFA